MLTVPPLEWPDSREQMRAGGEHDPALEVVSGEPPCFGLDRFEELAGCGELVGDFSVEDDDLTGEERLLDEYMSGLLWGIFSRRWYRPADAELVVVPKNECKTALVWRRIFIQKGLQRGGHNVAIRRVLLACTKRMLPITKKVYNGLSLLLDRFE